MFDLLKIMSMISNTYGTKKLRYELFLTKNVKYDL